MKWKLQFWNKVLEALGDGGGWKGAFWLCWEAVMGLLHSRWPREKTQGQPGLAMPWLGYAQMRIDRAVVFVFYRAEHFKES